MRELTGYQILAEGHEDWQWLDARCSVCDQPWGDGAYSQHERCATLYEDGSRRYAECITTALLDTGEVVRYMGEF